MDEHARLVTEREKIRAYIYMCEHTGGENTKDRDRDVIS